MINMMEKVPTRVNTQTPLTNFWTAKNLHGSAFSLLATRGTRGTVQVFELQTVPQSVREFARAFWKRSEREKQWGEGVRSESRKTPLMVLLTKLSSFRILPVYQVMVNALNGLFWQLLSTLEGILPYGNTKWQRWDHQLEGLLSKKYLVR